jgi:dTDP-4-amino-4,6-dideoxygalactose transaminase
MSEINSFIGVSQMSDLDMLLKKQRNNASVWIEKISEMKNVTSLIPKKNSSPNNWIYGVLAKNKIETINTFRNQGFYATSVHINNNIYSAFGNNIELKGVSEFMNHFVAIPCGWWVKFNNKY